MGVESIGTPWLWAGFTVLILALLGVDLGLFHRRAHVVGMREALCWTAVWIALALMFSACVYLWFGSQHALEFFTGYLIEKALSVDNIFVFLVIFSYFAVPSENHHRVLFWGIIGALILRAVFIVLGAALLQRFHWVMYLFGAFLVITGARLLRRAGEVHPERNPLFLAFRRIVPSVKEYRGAHFTVREGGRRFATPMLLVLLCVEASDIVFAVDSIPAIFAITRDPFIVYTSNVFAILGLRALYFVLAGVMREFHYLRPGLAVVLVFIGVKMTLTDLYEIPVLASLAVVAAVLAGAAAASMLWPPAERAGSTPPQPALRAASEGEADGPGS